MRAEIISCGTELLLGYNIDTNSAYISNALSHIGIDVYHHTTVGDNKERLSAAINYALSRSDIVISSGGLGPTVDDITMAALANVTRRDLVFNKTILKDIKKHFEKSLFKMPKGAIRQALIPRGADWIKNEAGTAPGLIIRHEDKHLIALPGPPRELKPMLEEAVIPYLKKLKPQGLLIKSKSLKLIGLPEVKVNEKIKGLLSLSGRTTLGIYAHLGELELRITAKAEGERKAAANITAVEKKIRRRFGDFIYGSDDDTLQGVLGLMLTKLKKSLSIAESCTGGYISNLITNSPGSSRYFIMGIIAYSNSVKVAELHIEEELLKRYGAVSREVAKAMADNVRELAKADIGLGVTGIAGPTGQTKKKPIGLVYVSMATKKKKIVKEFRFVGSREEIKLQAAQQALNLLRLNI